MRGRLAQLGRRLLGVAVPSFWLAMILVSVFALDWRLLPATGAVPFWIDPADSLRHAVLPALALAKDRRWCRGSCWRWWCW